MNPYLAQALAEQQEKRAAKVAEAEGFGALTVDELKAEIDRRNEGRDDESRLSKTGNKAELVAALEADEPVDSQ